MRQIPPPPVPQKLREMLKDYPEYIQVLQEDLNHVTRNYAKSIPLFEQAIWALEGALSSFIYEAREELKVAEASGDMQAIEKAKAKVSLMFGARSGNGGMRLGLMDNLWDYFQKNKGAFE